MSKTDTLAPMPRIRAMNFVMMDPKGGYRCGLCDCKVKNITAGLTHVQENH